jgi:hypothetical protein
MVSDPQSPYRSRSMMGKGTEVRDETDVVHSPRNLLPNSFDFESGSWSIVNGEILRPPGQKGKPVAKGGIIRTERDELDAIFERLEALTSSDKIPDRKLTIMAPDPQSPDSMIFKGIEEEEDERDDVHQPRTLRSPDPLSPDSTIFKGIEEEEDERDDVHQPRTLHPNSYDDFDFESGSGSTLEREILRSPRQKWIGGKPVAEREIMDAEGVVFERTEKIPDHPPKGIPLAIELNNSLVNEDYAPRPVVKSSYTGEGTKRCKARNKPFLKKKPADDRNAVSRLGGRSASEEEPYAAGREEKKKEEHPESSCTGVSAKTCTANNLSLLKKKPDDDRKAASWLWGHSVRKAEPCVARDEEEKKEEYPKFGCTGVSAKACKVSDTPSLKKKPDDDRKAASWLWGHSVRKVEPCVARDEEETKEEYPKFGCTGVSAKACKASDTSSLKKKPDDDRNAASRLGGDSARKVKPYRNGASRLGEASTSEEEPYVAEKKEEHPELDPRERSQAVIVKPTKQHEELSEARSLKSYRTGASRLGEGSTSEEEPYVAEKKEEHPELDPRERSQAVIVKPTKQHEELSKADLQERSQAVVDKPTKQQLQVLGIMFQRVETFLFRNKRAKDVDPDLTKSGTEDSSPDLKHSGTDDSPPITLHPITPKPEQQKVMLDYVSDGVEVSVYRESGDTNVGSQQEDLEAGIPTLRIKVGANMLRERGDTNAGSQQEDLEAGIPTLNTKVGVNMLREHSLLDLEQSWDTRRTGSDSVDDSIRRLQELRRKKRDIESRIRSSSTEPGILVPNTYSGKSATPKAKSVLASEVLAKKERKEQHTKKLMALVIAVSFLAAMIVLGISFFFSP